MSNHDRGTYRECEYLSAEETARRIEAVEVVIVAVLYFVLGFIAGGGA